MAAVTLGSKAEGSIIRLKENGVLADFYIAKQNYESGLNGSGRVLVVRKDCYDPRQWHGSNVNAYATSAIDTWLNSTYKSLLDADIRTAMGTTKIYYTPGNGNTTKTTLERSVFLLSGTELGQTQTYLNVEGTALSSTVLNLLRTPYLNGSTVNQWTRSPRTDVGNCAWCWGLGDTIGYNFCDRIYGSRPTFTLPSSLYVNDDGSVSVNAAPSAPGSITYPTSISGGANIAVSWGVSTDAEGNLAGYIVERSIDGGTSWTQIYQGGALSTTNNVAFGTASVMYRVKAYDTEGLTSGWRTGAQITVLNNRAPNVPTSIAVPNSVKGGSPLAVSWTKATDDDGNLSGYELERSVNGGGWSQVYRGPALSYTDNITKGWLSVAYRVRAYDSCSVYSGYTASPTRTVDNNTAPVIASSTANGTDLGIKKEGFVLTYKVTDADADAVTVTEYLDNAVQRSYKPVLGGENVFQAVAASSFQRVLNGDHTLKVTASDGKVDSGPYTVTFEKRVTRASVTLLKPMDADAKISLCVLSVSGSIPADAQYTVEVTNNAKDAPPVWEDCTASVRNGANHVFQNSAAAKGFAFNFRVTVERGPSGQGGYITSIQGGFQ